MTETEKMEKHITSIRRLGEVLHKSIGSNYHAISLQLVASSRDGCVTKRD
jgi:hypothetical protein